MDIETIKTMFLLLILSIFIGIVVLLFLYKEGKRKTEIAISILIVLYFVGIVLILGFEMAISGLIWIGLLVGVKYLFVRRKRNKKVSV